MPSKFAGLAIATDVAARMTLLHPVTRAPLVNAGTGEPGWIDLLPLTSKAAREHDRAVNDKIMRLRGRARTSAEIEADSLDKIAKMVTGWSLVTLDGAPLDVPFSPEAARELLGMPEAVWLRDQCWEHCADLGNFQKTPSTN